MYVHGCISMMICFLSLKSFTGTPNAPASFGFVSKIEEKFLIVAFCGDVHGIMFKKDLNLEPEDNIEDNFSVGQPIKCFVSSCSPRDQKLRLCLQKRESSASSSVLAVGSVHSVVVSEKNDSQLTCSIGNSVGIISKRHVCDALGHAEKAFERIEIGHSLDAVVIESSPRILLSLKPLLLESIRSKPDTLSDLVVGRVIAGYVKNITSFGVFVSILPGLTAFASKSALSDSFVADPSKVFEIDQSVLARVDSVDLEQSRISVSLKSSAIGNHHVFLSHFFSERAQLYGTDSVSFRAGTKVEAEIIACTSSGAVVDLGDLGDGLLDASQWDSVAPIAGSKVSCVVLDYCESKECLEVCSKKRLVAPKMSEKNIASAIKKCLASNTVFDVTVEMLREEYAIVRAPALHDALCVLTNAHFNFQTCHYAVGQSIKSVTVVKNGDSECGHIYLQQTSNLLPVSKELPSLPAVKEIQKAEPGNIVSGKITSVDSMQLNIRLGVGQKGRVHISEVQDLSTHDVTSGNPFRLSQFSIGQDVRVRVLQMRDDGLLELSMRLSDNNTKRPALSTLSVGDEVIGFAQGASADGVWLQLAPGLRGRIHPLDFGFSSKDVLNVNHIADGTPLSAVVVRVDIGSKVIDLTLRRPSKSKLPTSSLNASMSLRGIDVGAIIPCKITRVIPGAALLVSLAPHIQGRISIIDVNDQLLADPFAAFSVGDVIDAQVSEVEASDPPIVRCFGLLSIMFLRFLILVQVHLTCRESKVCPSKTQDVSVRADLLSYSDLFVGQVVSGYVRTSSKSGVFVTLGRKVSARVVLKDLSDKFVADISKSYPPGKLVQGRVTAVDVAEGHASLNLKTSVLSCLKRISLEDIVPGCIVLGKVKSTQSYGLFLSIDHSDLVGFVHISQMSDDFVKNVTQVAAIGDAVKAKVQKVEHGKIWLGMKAEDIQSGDIINDEGASDAEDESDDDESSSGSGSSDEERDDNESESSSSNENSESESESSESESEDGDIEGESGQEAVQALQEVPRSAVVPFAWDAFEQMTSQNVKNDAPFSTDSDESGMSDDGDEPKQSKQSKRRQARTQELDIRRHEEDLLSGAGAPASINDFERLVVANPNSSIIWIRYMAFLLSLAEVEKARGVGERALKTIVFREESEKLNVWTSLLNLENMFGTSDSLFEKFKKACQFNDEKKVHFAFADILIRRGDDDLTLPFFKIFSRKFSQSGKVWVKLAELHLQKGRVDAFKETMERCVLAIPRRKHTKTIVKFILLEFNNGSAERGRTLMEGVLSQNPKRIDLWSVYVDMEIKVGEVERARSILDRIITLPIKARQMKFVFKKMLDVEKKHGGPEQVEEVKRKAREYVARNMQ
jgi:rRNA biogenesis protein RRP5